LRRRCKRKLRFIKPHTLSLFYIPPEVLRIEFLSSNHLSHTQFQFFLLYLFFE
jgi:hypothetical protein